MKRLLFISLLLFLGTLTACSTTPLPSEPAQKPETQSSDDAFYSGAVGFGITKPSAWYFISDEILQEDRNTIRLEDAELDKLVKEYSNIPLVVFARNPEPYPDLNPSVSVSMAFLPVEGMAPTAALKMSTEISKQAYPDLTVVEPVREHEIDGLPGAYTKIRYTASFADGKSFPILARMWIVPRGKIMFIIGMTGSQNGPDVFENIWKDILHSIRIEK